MKVKQIITQRIETFVYVELPLYIQIDSTDEHLYISTSRYEVQKIGNAVTFIVTEITQTSDGYEYSEGQRLSVDCDLSEFRVSRATWDEVVRQADLYHTRWMEKLRR